MGLVMSPVVLLACLERSVAQLTLHTLSVFELALHHRIVDIRHDLQLCQSCLHALQSQLLVRFILWGDLFCLQLRYSLPLLLDQLDLLLAVLLQECARFLETLIRELAEGDRAGAGDCGSTATGADGVDLLIAEELSFGCGSRDGIGISSSFWDV